MLHSRLFGALGVCVAALLSTSCSSQPESVPSSSHIPENLRFGIPVDSFDVREKVVPGGTTMGALLADLGLDAIAIQRLVQACHNVFDPRHLRAGRPLTLFLDGDSAPSLRHFVYEPDGIEYLHFDLSGPYPMVHRVRRTADTLRQTAAGTIRSSLWNDMTGAGLPGSLVSGLSDVFAWQIDFFGLQMGDSWSLEWEEIQVDGRTVGIGRITAARFRQGGQTHEAVLFRHDTINGYYDGQGRSLRRAFLRAPLQYARISSRFSASRLHPVLRIRRPHHGVDYAAPSGTPVVAIGDGTVVERGWDGGGGNFVKIRHNSTYTSGYLHLRGFASGVVQGGRVQQGQLLGWVGSTGLSSGPHLDFRFWRNGRPVDPLTVATPPAPPLDSALLEQFRPLAARTLARLDVVVPTDQMLARRDTLETDWSPG